MALGCVLADEICTATPSVILRGGSGVIFRHSNQRISLGAIIFAIKTNALIDVVRLLCLPGIHWPSGIGALDPLLRLQ